MARLTGLTIAEVQTNRLEVARKFARAHEVIVVLKGHRTLIAAPDGTVWVNPTGNPGMATGGTGDILTGMVAGLIAQHPQNALEATVLAVYLHGLAGISRRNRWGRILWWLRIWSVFCRGFCADSQSASWGDSDPRIGVSGRGFRTPRLGKSGTEALRFAKDDSFLGAIGDVVVEQGE